LRLETYLLRSTLDLSVLVESIDV